MRRSRQAGIICAIGLSVLAVTQAVSTQEGKTSVAFLFLPEKFQPISANGLPAGSVSLFESVPPRWVQELSPLELALLPEGSWIDPSAKLSWPLIKTEASDLGWRPLSEGEITQRKRELTVKALSYSAELADSLHAPYVCEGLRWTEQALSSTRQALATRYRLHLHLSKDEAGFKYDYSY